MAISMKCTLLLRDRSQTLRYKAAAFKSAQDYREGVSTLCSVQTVARYSKFFTSALKRNWKAYASALYAETLRGIGLTVTMFHHSLLLKLLNNSILNTGGSAYVYVVTYKVHF